MYTPGERGRRGNEKGKTTETSGRRKSRKRANRKEEGRSPLACKVKDGENKGCLRKGGTFPQAYGEGGGLQNEESAPNEKNLREMGGGKLALSSA